MPHALLLNLKGGRWIRTPNVLSILLVLSLLLGGTAASPAILPILTILYAAPGGATSGFCDDWSVACELRYAINQATTPGSVYIIDVEQGSYTPSNTGDRTASFNLHNGVSIEGGYASTPDHTRNPALYVTTLSGDLNGDDGSNFTNNGDNSYHVVNATDVDHTAVLDGLTISGGNADGGSENSRGGGLYEVYISSSASGSPTLNNVTITGNSAASTGGGMYNYYAGNPILTDVTFSYNRAGQGGGLWTYWGFALKNVAFLGNHATSGGGIYNNEYTPTITDATFYNNDATDGGAIYNAILNGVMLINVTFNGNHVTGNGGALFNQKGSGSHSLINPSLTNVILWGDSAAGSGNEVYNEPDPFYPGKATISSSVVQGGCPSGSTCTAVLSTDPMLQPLAQDGGLTETMATGAGSSAIDTGDDVSCPSTDQRGVNRPRGPHCDIGAYEHVRPVADFDGNYASDVGIFRPSTRGWFVKNQFSLIYGLTGDLPILGDYDGNGTTDVAVFRPSNAGWFIRNQTSGFYGLPGDVPVPGDYDGNGTTDWAVYRPSTSAWYIKNQLATIFGLPGDIPVPGDYNGVGRTDIAVYRPSTRGWFIQGQFSAVFGLSGDIPVPADYDSNGTTDIAVFRPSTNGWYVRGQSSTIYGLSGDVPVPADYDGNGTADIAVFRPSTSGWFVKNQFSTIFGTTGDYPLPAPDTNANGTPYQ